MSNYVSWNLRDFFVFGDVFDDFLLLDLLNFDFFGNFDLDFFLGTRILVQILRKRLNGQLA